MDTYEVAVLYHPDLEIDLEKGASKVKKIIDAAGGKIVNEDIWGRRKLAYPIAGNEQGIYVFYSVQIPGPAVATVEANFNITEEVIRFLITKPDLKAIEKASQAKAQRKRTDDDSKEKETAKE